MRTSTNSERAVQHAMEALDVARKAHVVISHTFGSDATDTERALLTTAECLVAFAERAVTEAAHYAGMTTH